MRHLLWFVLAGWLFLGGRAAGEPPLSASCFSFTRPLGRVIREADRITVVRVVRADTQSRTVLFRKVADLKGKSLEDIHLQFGKEIPSRRRQELADWSATCPTAIIFKSGDFSWIYMGNDCLLAIEKELTTLGRYGMYVGSVEKLRESVAAILSGKEEEVPIQAPEPPLWDEPSPIVRDWVWGKKGRVCRVRASLALHDDRSIVECKGGYFVGWGSGGPEAVPGLVAALRHKDPHRRAEAAVDLGQIDPPARAAVPALRTALHDPEGRVRVFAAEALARIDPSNGQTLPTLRAALKDREPATRRAAAVALAEVGPAARPALSALVSALSEEPETPTRAVIAYALGQVGPESSEPGCSCRDVVRALGRAVRTDPHASVRSCAVRALLKFGPEAKDALADLAAAMQDSESSIVWQVAALLARQGREGAAVLARALAEKNSEARLYAASSLAELGPHAKEAVPALRKALTDEDPLLRERAARSLLRIDRDLGVKEGVPVLARLLGDETYPSDRRDAIPRVLANVGPEARAAVPALVTLLEKWGWGLFNLAPHALGRIGPGAAAAVPALLKIIETGPDEAQERAVEALLRIAPNAAQTRAAVLDKEKWKSISVDNLGSLGPRAAPLLPALKRALRESKDEDRRVELAVAVWQIGRPIRCGELVVDEGQEAVEVLLEILSHRKAPSGSRTLWNGISLLGAEARPLLPAILAVYRRGSSDERKAIRYCLGAIGPAAAPAVPLLEQELKTTRDPEDRLQIAVILAQLGNGRAAVPILLEALEGRFLHPKSSRRYIGLLGSLRGQARSAVPLLLRVLRKEDQDHYWEAAAALYRIDPDAAVRAGIPDPPPVPNAE
jgi:HEAT repeat protein